MRRALSLALSLIMVLSFTMIAQAAARTEYTWYDAAETQMKTETYYDDDDIRRWVYEYPAPGDTSYDYIYTSYGYEDGGISYKQTSSSDASGKVRTYNSISYDESGKVDSSGLREYTYVYDGSGNYLGYNSEEKRYNALGDLTYEYVGNSITGTTSGIWYEGKNGAISQKSSSSRDASGLVNTRETLEYDYETGDLRSKTISVDTEVLDENGDYLGYKNDEKRYNASGRMTYESVQDSIAGTSSSTWYEGKNGAVSRKTSSAWDATGLVYNREELIYHYETGALSFVQQQTETYDDNDDWVSGKSETRNYDVAGRLTRESFSDMEGNETFKQYQYSKDDKVIETKTGTVVTDQDTGDSIRESTVFDAKGRKTAEERYVHTYERDDADDIIGRSDTTETKYFAADGSLIKTETSYQEYDGDWNVTERQRAIGNGTGITTSSLGHEAEWDKMERQTAQRDMASLFDGQSGKSIASVEITEKREFGEGSYAWSDPVKVTRTSVNGKGQTVASYVYERKDDGSSVGKYQYFDEQSGKLRKVVEEKAAPDADGNLVRTTSITNAAGIVTESGLITEKADLATTEHRKFDSVTGKLKTVTARKDTYGVDYAWEESVENAQGIRISSVSGKSFTNKDGWNVWETTTSRFDPLSGKLLDQGKQINESLYKDDVYQSKTTRYDQDGKLLGIDKWGDGPLLDGKKKVIGYYSNSESYDAKGILKDADRQETSYLFDAQDRRIGDKTITKDKDGKVIYTREYTELYDKRGIYLGDASTETYFNADGSVSEVYKSSYNADTETAEYVTTNGKGRVLCRSSEVYDKVDGRQLGRTLTKSNYSEFTGNLMTTTTTKTKSESTGVFAESQRGVRADGQASHESDLSYMFVEGYGFLNYRNVYKDYLYRADGTLKYTIAGNRLMDNFYLDLFANDNYWDVDYLARYKFTEEFETKTAASGILAREQHLINNYEQGIDSQEYSVETKHYDEKTGALKSITTETLDYDPDLQKTVTRAVTVNAQGALIGESTEAYENDVNDQWKNLGSSRTAFLGDGRQIIAYNADGAGNSEGTSKTYSASTGGLLMSSVSKKTGKTSTTETLSYNAAGQVIRREVVSTGADGVTMTDAYDAAGAFLSRSVYKSTVGADGSRTNRTDEVDTQGRAISTEWFYPAGGNSRVRTSTFYDQEGKFHTEITTYDETGASRTTDANGTLLSYGVLTDKGDLNEFYANGKPKTAIARDDDDELRVTSFDKDGYINYVSIDHPDRPYTMYYDGNGKVAEIFYQEASGRTAYYNAADKQWYSGTGVDKVAIDVPDFAAGIDMSDIETGGRARPRGSWYLNNTVCAFGIHLRDIKPELTSKWYTVTPIDLSRDGTQSFEMIGGNMWIIGQVNVTVEGDNVTVSYDIIKDGVGRTTVKSEYFNIFADLNAITEDALEGDSKDGKGYTYGEPISIEKDLGGDTNVLLYVRNVATFNTRVYGERYLVRMWENLPERRERRADMEKLMDMDLAPAAEASGN